MAQVGVYRRQTPYPHYWLGFYGFAAAGFDHAQRLSDYTHRLIDLLVGDVQRGQEADAVGVQAGTDGNQTALEAFLRHEQGFVRRGDFGIAVFHQFH